MPVRWVRSEAELAEVCAELAGEEVIALDVETTIRT
jgi:ribonuclease D